VNALKCQRRAKPRSNSRKV